MEGIRFLAESPNELSSPYSVLHQTHERWLASRFAECMVIHDFPPTILDDVSRIFFLSPSERAAETDLHRFCRQYHAVGISTAAVIRYRWLTPRLGQVPSTLLDSMRSFGWEEQHIRAAREMSLKADDIAERVKGAAGWLTCCPAFQESIRRLHGQWSNLSGSDQPALPIARSACFRLTPTGLDVVEHSSQLRQFMIDFNAFCDKWRLTGMATWDLPDPDGPKWPDLRALTSSTIEGQVQLDTPWHFALRTYDGLGQIVKEEYDRLISDRGASDITRRWGTYGRLLEIDHWERVFRGRYSDRRRPRNFVTQVEGILANLMGLDQERVRKLRKTHSALQSGRRYSLPNWR